jgi:tetratricopeptide (TPR) repeat protein
MLPSKSKEPKSKEPIVTGKRAAGPLVIAALIVCLAGLIVSLTLFPMAENDIWFHLKAGEWILAHKAVPRVEEFSYTAAGREYIVHEWLSAVFFALVHNVGGVPLLILSRILFLGLLGFILLKTMRDCAVSWPIATAVTGFVVFTLGFRAITRPHIIGWVFMALLIYLFLRARLELSSLRLLILVPLLEVLWVNCHGSFLLGPLVAGTFLAEEILAALLSTERRWKRSLWFAAVVGAMVLAFFVNPYGTKMFIYPFGVAGSELYAKTVYEWMPVYAPMVRTTWTFYLWMFWGILFLFLAYARLVVSLRPSAGPQQKSAKPAASPFTHGLVAGVLVFLGLLYLSVRMSRNIDFYLIATAPFLAMFLEALAPAARLKPAPARALAASLCVVLIAGSLFIGLKGYPFGPHSRRSVGLGIPETIPVDATRCLKEHGFKGRILTDYSNGSYVLYHLYPDAKVGMDSRDVYGEELYKEWQSAWIGESLADYLAKYDVNAVLFTYLKFLAPQKVLESFFKSIEKLAAWHLVYFDDAFCLFLKDTEAQHAWIESEGYACLDPNAFAPLKRFRCEPVQALAEATRAVKAGPQAVLPRMMLAEALAASRRIPEAVAAAEEATRLKHANAEAWSQLAFLYVVTKQRTKAVSALEEALRLRPGWESAEKMLSKLKGGAEK